MGFKNITIDDIDKPNQPSGKPLPDYDRAKGHAPDTRPAKRGGLPWYVGLTLALGALLIGGYLVVRFTQWLAETSYETVWLDVYLIALIKIALFVAPIAAAGICCYWLYQKAAQARIIRLQNQMPIARRFVERDDWQGAALASLGAFYATEQEWARHSTYRSLNQLDLSRSITGARSEPIEAQIIPDAPAMPQLPIDVPILQSLRDKGHICRSGESLMLGYNNQQPIYIRWAAAGVSALAGRSGSGKTSTARFLLAQAAMNGAALVICDPHGASSDESLVQSSMALSGAFLFEPAIEQSAILGVVRAVDQLGRTRIEGRTNDRFPLLLLIDEFTSLMLNSEAAEQIVKALVNVANEYRKVNIQAILISHTWKADIVSAKLGSTLRSAIGARIVHQTDPHNARFLISAEQAQGVDRLRTGEALFFDGGTVACISVPYVDSAALEASQAYIPRRDDWPIRYAMASEKDFAAFQSSTEQSIAHSARDKAVIAMFAQGCTYDEVRAHCKRLSITIDQNRLPELRAMALNGH